MRHIYHFSASLRGQKLDLLQPHQRLVVIEQELVHLHHDQLMIFPFHFHRYPTREQLKLTKYSLPF